MQISGNFSVSGVDSARPAARVNASNAVASPAQPIATTPIDKLELSPEALSVGNANASGETFRAEKVASLREAIAQGNYDTDEKVSAALDNFLDQLG
ncbi:MAG: flagellar biosynthesis anti-sigma factor FlgM [Pirellula sp.]